VRVLTGYLSGRSLTRTSSGEVKKDQVPGNHQCQILDMEIIIGCCGWSYLRPPDFNLKDYPHILVAYSRLFNAVEVNTTFYRIPRQNTARNWRALVDKESPKFEFTVKCSQIVTHRARFKDSGISAYNATKDICKVLNATLLLFQSSAGFKLTDENLNQMKWFFGNIKRDNLEFVWEPRGEWYEHPEKILEFCKEFNVIHCVDPLRNEPLFFGKKRIAYFRLHGFGSPSMYNYSFSSKELDRLAKICDGLSDRIDRLYVFFNNATCYEDGLRFKKMF